MTANPLEGYINSLTRPYWDGLQEHRLMLATCDRCGHKRPPPDFRTRGGPFVFIAACPKCGLDDFTWTESNGKGIVETFIWYMAHLDPDPPELSPFKLPIPYNVSVVKMEEGPRLITNIVGVDFAELAVGMGVTAAFADLGEWTILRFLPAVSNAAP